MKKNIASLVLAIIGAIFGLIGGILWAACADTAADLLDDGGSTIYLACYIVFGIGGAVLSLVGGIQSYNRKKGGLVCSVLGLLFQVAVLIASCVHVGGFSFLLELCTIVAIILLLVQVIMAARKPQQNEPKNEPNRQ